MIEFDRAAGVLLHVSSLPGRAGIGTLGSAARAFVDWLVEAGASYWQILPLVAVDEGGSPYDALSAMAGNPLLIDADDLVRDGLIDRAPDPLGEGPVDYAAATRRAAEIVTQVQHRLGDHGPASIVDELDGYRARHSAWLPDYALFRALRESHDGRSWTAWPAPLRDRDPDALAAARAKLADRIEHNELAQFLFDRQWSATRAYGAERGVRIIGDIPIFVAHDSADVWAEPDLFVLDHAGRPTVVSGVPPDYFSETGQRWGNPLYDWDRLRADGYRWWIRRFARTREWVDLVRVDHFRGFEAFWEIDADEPTAVRGRWRKGPGRAVFDAVESALGAVPVVAEDLGLITPEVEELRDELGFPGMRVLQFAFDGADDNPHLPENYPEQVLAYTGTHDNATTAGWWDDADDETRARVRERIGQAPDPPVWPLIEMILRSRAALAILPVQDVLGLGNEARMNIPGTTGQNWRWRLITGQLDGPSASALRDSIAAARRMTAGRAGTDSTERS